MSGAWKLVIGLVLILGLGASSQRAPAQSTFPVSLSETPGVHIFSYDNKQHRKAEHYNALFRVVLKEFGLPTDTIPSTNLVFIDKGLESILNDNNAKRFMSTGWCGAYIQPSIIMILGEEESDDTFMHECMHYLHQQGMLFRNIQADSVHRLIYRNEGLLLGSRSYLEFLKTHPR